MAAGTNAESEMGLPGTVEKNIAPDPVNSLRGLVDRDFRLRIVEANEASSALKPMNVQGVGHSFWVDRQSGFSEEDQKALILYLLTYEPGQ